MSLTEILSRAPPSEDARAAMEFEKMRFELSWRHFDFHARQRTQLFHFFIILTPFIFGGCFYLFREQTAVGFVPAIIDASAGAFLALIFFGLDRRNKQLITVSEQAIKLLEKDFLFTSGFRPLSKFEGPMNTEERETATRRLHHFRSYSFLVGAVYWLVFFTFVGLVAGLLLVRAGYLDLTLPSDRIRGERVGWISETYSAGHLRLAGGLHFLANPLTGCT